MAGDLYFNDVVLLLHGDGADGSTVFTDSSNSAHTVSPSGNAQIDTAQSKFGGSSMKFDGSGDYLSITDHSDFHLSGDFTIECFARVNAFTTSNPIIISQRRKSSANFSFYFELGSAILLFYYSTSGTGITDSISHAVSLSTDTQYHLAVTREGTTLRLFIDGALVNSGTGAAGMFNSIEPVRISALNTPVWSGSYWDGWLDELRVTNGTARYTAAFTVPTEAFPDYQDDSILAEGVTGSITLTGNTGTVEVSDNEVSSGSFGSLILTGNTGTVSVSDNAASAGTLGSLSLTAYPATVNITENKFSLGALGNLTLAATPATVSSDNDQLSFGAPGGLTLVSYNATVAITENKFIQGVLGALTLTGFPANSQVIVSPGTQLSEQTLWYLLPDTQPTLNVGEVVQTIVGIATSECFIGSITDLLPIAELPENPSGSVAESYSTDYYNHIQ